MAVWRKDPRQDLLRGADRAEEAAADLPDRAAVLLATVAGHLRDAAAVYDVDPTLESPVSITPWTECGHLPCACSA